MLKGFTPRLYQETILATCALKNTLVVLPTGMGKTGVALLLSVQRFKQFPNTKVVMLAPTKPLVEQHRETFVTHLDIDPEKLVVFTGEIAPQKRAELWAGAKIIFATPQGLENDLVNEKISFKQVSLLIVDEAHRAVKEYSYVFLAKQYQRQSDWPRILGVTASPGGDVETITDVCKNLFIEAVEIRSEKDPDVAPYIQEVEFEVIKVDLSEDLLKVKKFIDTCVKSKIEQVKLLGLKGSLQSKRDLLGAQAELQRKVASGERDFEVLRAMSVLAEIMKASHALELLESQGVAPLNQYLEGLFASAESSTVKAVKNLTMDVNFKSAFVVAQKLLEQKVEHPKMAVLRSVVEKEIGATPKKKMIVFTQFRDTATKLASELNGVQGVIAKVFVGQAKKKETGLSQKQQTEMLDWFKDGLFNVLIATSVAEEGLDIPKVDCVVFYEPIPSAIRSIQRRGRTGRTEKGRVILLMTKNTREEAYSWSAKIKERKMVHALEEMRRTLNVQFEPQQVLQKFDANIKIFADYREKGSGIVKHLIEHGVHMRLEMLPVADFVLSSRVGVEVKLVHDFVSSIIDGRLLDQLKSLKASFERPIVIIQGTENIYGVRNVHPNAIRAMISTIIVGYGIPIIQTPTGNETAELLIAIAKREQEQDKRDFAPHADRKPVSYKEQQEYIVSCFPNIGPVIGKELLKKFKSIKGVVNASKEELQGVEGVGEKKAGAIKEIVDKEYQ